MLAWMLYVIMVTLLLSVGAYVAERAERLRRARTRWIWITAIVASLALPTLVSSVSIELPNVMAAPVAQKVVALRDATPHGPSPRACGPRPAPPSHMAGATSIRR